MEIGLTALITVSNLLENGFLEIAFYSPSEFFSTILCFSCIIALLISPIFTVY